MRILIALVVGLVVGWFARQWTLEESKDRVARRADVVVNTPDRTAPAAGEPARPAMPAAATPPADATAEEAPADAEEGAEADPIADMIRSQRTTWKGFASMQAKQKIEALLGRGIQLDPEAEKRIQEALLADVDRQVDRAIAMMLGEEELDPDAFAFFLGLPPDLTPDVERELATFLTDAEIGHVREEVKRAYDRQLTDMADMQIGMMSVPNLRDDQRTRLREVFKGRDVMKEQFTRFAEFTRDRKRLVRILDGNEDISGFMRKNFEPTRRRVREILDDQQYARYEAYEETMIRQAQMGLKMMTAMAKK